MKGRERTGGIGCFDGVLMTPRGLYNVIQTARTEEFPQAQVLVPFEGFSEKSIQKGDSIKDIMRRYVILHDRSRYNKPENHSVVFLGKNKEVYDVEFDTDFKIKKVSLNSEKKEEIEAQEQKRRERAVHLESLRPVVSRFLSVCEKIYEAGSEDEHIKYLEECNFPINTFIQAFKLLEKDPSEGGLGLLENLITWLGNAYRRMEKVFKIDEDTKKELDALYEEIRSKK